MSTRAEIFAEARNWVDTPYQHQQRMKGVAVDCLGLLIGVAKTLGICDPSFDVTGYTRFADAHTLMAKTREYLVERDLGGEWQYGQVLVLVTDRYPQHYGILAPYRHGGLSIIHANSQATPPRVVEVRLMLTRGFQPVGLFDFAGVHT